MTGSTERYKRVVVTGTLSCESDLHVGDGGFETDRKIDGQYNTVCRDITGKAYIPASTLRGSFAAIIDEETTLYEKFFGYSKNSAGNQPGKRQAGILRFHDAMIDKDKSDSSLQQLPFWSSQHHTFLIHNVSIDPVTGTADKGKLFCSEFVPEKTYFTMSLEADDLTMEELCQLLALLREWAGKKPVSIGKKVTKGYGKIKWIQREVEGFNGEQEKKWLADDSLTTLLPFASVNITKEEVNNQDISELLARKKDVIEFSLSIQPESPLLINESGYVKEEKGSPDLEYNRRGDRVLIPSNTLAGLIRGRARRILATIAHLHFDVSPNKAIASIQELVEDFFGSEGKRGALWLSDASGEAKEHRQFFVGVDRFTGGVCDGANYDVRAAECEELKTGHCYINMSQAPDGDWWKGMLFLVLRDGMEGDLQVGWGKAKGYGAIRCYLEYNNTVITSVIDLIQQDTCDEEGVKGWVRALHDKVDMAVQANNGEEK